MPLVARVPETGICKQNIMPRAPSRTALMEHASSRYQVQSRYLGFGSDSEHNNEFPVAIGAAGDVPSKTDAPKIEAPRASLHKPRRTTRPATSVAIQP